jgi:hypothetical protein
MAAASEAGCNPGGVIVCLAAAPPDRVTPELIRIANSAVCRAALVTTMTDYHLSQVRRIQSLYEEVAWHTAAHLSIQNLLHVAGPYVERCRSSGQLVEPAQHLLYVALIERYGGLERVLADTSR